MLTKKSRKRKSETIQDLVNRILNEVEEVMIDGIRQKRTKLDIILLQLRAASMKGDQLATKLMLDLRKGRPAESESAVAAPYSCSPQTDHSSVKGAEGPRFEPAAGPTLFTMILLTTSVATLHDPTDF